MRKVFMGLGLLAAMTVSATTANAALVIYEFSGTGTLENSTYASYFNGSEFVVIVDQTNTYTVTYTATLTFDTSKAPTISNSGRFSSIDDGLSPGWVKTTLSIDGYDAPLAFTYGDFQTRGDLPDPAPVDPDDVENWETTATDWIAPYNTSDIIEPYQREGTWEGDNRFYIPGSEYDVIDGILFSSAWEGIDELDPAEVSSYLRVNYDLYLGDIRMPFIHYEERSFRSNEVTNLTRRVVYDEPTAVPAPFGAGLLLLGLSALGWSYRRRK